MGNPILLIIIAATMFAVIGGLTLASHLYNLNGIKSKTVGDGQHGTARFSSKGGLRRIYKFVPFEPKVWRAAKGKDLHLPQGVIVGCQKKHGQTVALVDTGDVHTMMIGAAGCGKTAFWLYPNLEYACAAGMSFLTTDTKGDLYRNYGNIAKEKYGYSVAVIDLRNPTKSDGNNLLHLVNKYMDLSKENPDNLAYRAKAEKYAKIIAKTLIYNDGDASAYGQNAFFYDAAEGLLTAAILLIAEYAPSAQRHIVSVFKLIQDLLARGRGTQYLRPSHAVGHVHGHVPPQRFSRLGIGAGPLFRYRHRCGKVLQGEMRRLYRTAGGKSEHLLHGKPAHPADVPGDSDRGGRERRGSR